MPAFCGSQRFRAQAIRAIRGKAAEFEPFETFSYFVVETKNTQPRVCGWVLEMKSI